MKAKLFLIILFVSFLTISHAGIIGSVQRGDTTTSGTGGSYTDVTITAVTLSKSFCFAWSANPGVIKISKAPTLTSTTNLRIYWSASATGTHQLTWEVVEFN